MKPTPIATPVKAFEAIAPATNLKPITNNCSITDSANIYNIKEVKSQQIVELWSLV